MARRRDKGPATRKPPEAGDRVGWRWLVAIFLVAVAYRALCFWSVGDHPLLRRPAIDAGQHDAWARRIAGGDWLGHGPDDVFKPPMYPTFLGLLYKVFGRHIALAQWVQYGLGAASCLLVAVLAGRLLGPRAGRVAGFVSAAYAPYVFFESQLLTPALSMLLNVGALAVLTAGEGRPGRWRWAAGGALIGLSAGVRPDVLLPAGLVVAYLLLRGRPGWRRWALDAAYVSAPVLAVVLAIGARNVHVGGQFVVVSSNGGINLYVGNARGADGVTAVPVGLRWERLVARVPQAVLERPGDTSRRWMRAAWREVRAAPGEAAARLARKALAFWNAREFRNNICYHYLARAAWPLRASPGQFAVVAPLAVLGLVCLWRRGGGRERTAWTVIVLWVAGYWAVGIVFFVTARFRLPAVPLLIVAGSWALVELGEAARRRRWRGLAWRLGVVAAAGAVCWPPWLGSAREGWARDEVNLGNSLRAGGDVRGAQAAYRAALALAPDDPDAHYLLGLTFVGQRPHEALEHLEAARRVMADAPDVLLALAQVHARLGHRDRAREAASALIELGYTSNLRPKRAAVATAHILMARLDPASEGHSWQAAWATDARTAAEAAFLRRRELPRVLDTFEREARSAPWDWYSQANLGMALLDQGRAGEAVAAFRRAVRLAPERDMLRMHLARALIAAGQRDEAARLLQRLLRDLPDGPARRQVEALRSRLRTTRPGR